MAYGNIKGITIEINGDTSKLTTALKNVDGEARTVRKSLRDIQESLKYDKSKGPELAAQKQRELARAIENTKAKLEILKKGQAEMSEEFKKTNEGSRAYDNLTREMDKTERQLKSFEAQADKTYQKLTKIRDTASNFGKAAQDVGSGLTKKITAPIIGAGGIVSKFAMDFEAEMSKVKAISGATGDDFISLENKAREMGAKTKFSASEAAEALEYMAMAGWKPKEMLEGIEGVMNLAAASGEDLALTSDIVTDSLTAFGLSAKDSTHFADILAATSSNANTNVAMMGETFKYAAPIAGTLGYSVEDTALAIGLMANSGIKGSQAGTALRTGLTRLASPTKEVEKGMELLGLSMEDIQGKSLDETLRILRNSFDDLDGTQQTQAASMIFGQNAMSGMLKIIQASEGDYNKLSDAIGNADGAAKDMSTTMQDNLEGDLDKLKSAAEELAISFGELLIPALRDGVDKLTDLIDKFIEMPDSIKQIILDIAGFAAVLGPIIWIVGKVSSGIGLISGALAVMQGSMVGATPAMIGLGKMFSFIKLAFSSLKTLLLGHPIAAIVIGALTIVLPLIIQNWDAIKEYLVTAWESIKEIASNVWTGISAFFAGIWDGIKEVWAIFWDPIGEWIGERIQAIVDVAKPIFDTFINIFQVGWMLIEEIFTTAWELISGFFRENWGTLVSIADAVFTPLKEFISAIWEGIRNVTINIWEGIKSFLSSLWQSISDTVKPIFDGIKNFISIIWDGIRNITQSTWETIKNLISGLINAAKDTVSSTAEAIKSVVSRAWNAIRDTTSNIWNGIKDSISRPIDAAKNIVSSVASSIESSLSGIWNSIKNTTMNVWEGVKDSIVRPINAAKDAVGRAIDRIKSMFNINLSFPHIKLPHFSISGGFSLNPPSVPHFGIEWYKKGGIFTKPTIFNTPYGMKGVGEAGAEAVLPIDRLSDLMAKAMASNQNPSTGVSITGNTFVVRQEEDIEDIARKLYRMIESKKRGVGLG